MVDNPQVKIVDNFHDLVTTSFEGVNNALCWHRKLQSNFAEIIGCFELTDNIVEIELDELYALQLSEQGKVARDILIADYTLLQDFGALPSLNIITHYDRDEPSSVLATDVYSYHVDKSPIPSDTFLCTYHGDASEIIPNELAIQKVLIPEIRRQLMQEYQQDEKDFESYLVENFYDLHYQPLPNTQPTNLGLGHLWRLATDHPESKVLPCIHRAPDEKSGLPRLLLIC